jgi:hypothetical protein
MSVRINDFGNQGFSILSMLFGIFISMMALAGLSQLFQSQITSDREDEARMELVTLGQILEKQILTSCRKDHLGIKGIPIVPDGTYPTLLSNLTSVDFGAAKLVKVGKRKNTEILAIRLMQLMPGLGANPMQTLVQLEIDARPYIAKKGAHWTGQIVKIALPFFIRTLADGTIDKCPGRRDEFDERVGICVEKGGLWRGEDVTPNCLIVRHPLK